jgi:hypothetical protein
MDMPWQPPANYPPTPRSSRDKRKEKLLPRVAIRRWSFRFPSTSARSAARDAADLRIQSPVLRGARPSGSPSQAQDYKYGMPCPPASPLLLSAPGIPPLSALTPAVLRPRILFLEGNVYFFYEIISIIFSDAPQDLGGSNAFPVKCSKPISFSLFRYSKVRQ